MKRTRPGNKKPYYKEKPIVISPSIINLLQPQENFSDLLALYIFYCHIANWQKTNQPRATIEYTAKGMSWGIDKVRLRKKRLLELGLIESVQRRGLNGNMLKQYIRVNYIWTKESILNAYNISTEIAGVRELPGSVKSDPNTCSALNKEKTYSANKKEILKKTKAKKVSEQLELNVPIDTVDILSPSLFSKFWELYPRNIGKATAMSKWNEICSHKTIKGIARPTWEQIENTLTLLIKYEWKDKEMQYIPHPTTWLNQARWLDEIDTTRKINNMKNTIGAYREGVLTNNRVSTEF